MIEPQMDPIRKKNQKKRENMALDWLDYDPEEFKFSGNEGAAPNVF